MNLKSILFFAVCLFANAAFAEVFFSDCNSVLKDNSYRLLNEHFSIVETGEEPTLCQRLNDQEYLYTTYRNLYYCKSDGTTPLSCEESETNHWFPNITIEKRFFGGKGKQFVIFKVSRLSHGNYSEGFHTFFLTPKKVNPRGYSVYFFQEAGASDQSEGDGSCEGNREGEVVTYATPKIEVLNENTSDVSIRFNQVRTNCMSSEKTRQTLEYSWKNMSFQLTKNHLLKLGEGH